jgi:hypothetical protein
MRRFVLFSLAPMLLAGCAVARAATVGGPVPGDDGPCGIPGELEYLGETSVAALGLTSQFGTGPEASRIGSVWMSSSGAAVQGLGGAGDRVICIEYGDGSAMASTIDGSWQPPAIDASVEDGGGGVPTPILLVGGSAIVIVGFSVVAFRRDATG